jgi:hypothetical protein
VAFGMLAKGARERLVDILEKGSCGEGGMNTVVAIHSNKGALCHPSKARSSSSLMAGGGGWEKTRLKTRPFQTTGALEDGHKARIADGHVDRQSQHHMDPKD